MKNKKRKLIGVAILTTILASGIGVYYIGEYLNEPTAEEIAKAKEEIEESFKTTEDDMPENEKIDLKEQFPDQMTEVGMQQIIHFMSHQKVKSENDTKWGYIRITEERVNRLLEVAKLNKENYISGNVYVSILERWSKGDFSQAHEDHNFIWELNNGNVGKATGLLNPWEEKEFIEESVE